jgi:hypothetical protein
MLRKVDSGHGEVFNAGIFQTQRQERAISSIQIDLNEKTNAIMRELTEVLEFLSAEIRFSAEVPN